MIKEELSKLLSNKLLLLVLIAIISIPSIYTILFLGSMWDPYGKLDNLPVAVVNSDISVNFEGKKLNIGDDLVENLKKNNSLQFNFVDKSTATRGLENGTFYMTITIPENFSQNASTFMNNNPQKMNLKYETNPGTNYIASKLSETAIIKIKDKISSEITQTYAKTMFESITEIGNGMEAASNGANKLYEGTVKLSNGNNKIKENLNKLSESTLTFQNGSNELQNALYKYTDGIVQINDGTKKLNDGLKNFFDKVASETPQLVSGSCQLDKGISEYTNGVKTISSSISKLNEKSNDLNNASTALFNGTTQIKTGSSSLFSGLTQISTQLGLTMSEEKQNQLLQIRSGLNSLNSNINILNSSVQQIVIPDTNSLISSISTPLENINFDTQSTTSRIQNIKTNLEKLSLAYPEINQDKNFEFIMQEIQNTGTELTDIKTQIDLIPQSQLNYSDSSVLTESIQKIKENIGDISNESNQVIPYTKQAIVELSDGIINIKSSLDKKGTNASDIGIIQGMQAVDNGILNLLSGSETLKNGTSSYTNAVNQIETGIKKINNNSVSLSNGTSTLSKGLNTLYSSICDGFSQIQNGTSSLYDGTNKLVLSKDDLLDGSKKLSDGAFLISDGANQLSQGSLELGNGLDEVKNGNQSLYSELNNGYNKINVINKNDKNTEMFASPIVVSGTQMTKVENNGHAMAAYMMSVGLWVACIAFTLIYPLMKYQGKLKSGFLWWLSKSAVMYPVSIIMAVVMVITLHLFNNFSPVEFTKTILVACITSVSFISIMYFFNVLIGKIGSFIMLIFMVVQLAGSSGTYPIELSGSFVSKIHKWMPFSYTVKAFRSTISGSGSIRHYTLVLMSLTLIFVVLTIGLFEFRTYRIQKEKSNIYEFLEVNGLA